jgi:hypothetical protein
MLVASAASGGGHPCPPRPDFSIDLDKLAADIVAKTPAFKYIDPAAILFIASDARHASRATTRPSRFNDGSLSTPDGRFVKPVTTFNGKPVKYIVELRPKFFRYSTVESRIKTIIHELNHMSGSFDGTIPEEKSHKNPSDGDFETVVVDLTKAYVAKAAKSILRPLAGDGEVMMRMWFDRPKNRIPVSDANGKRLYTERDIFMGPVEMITSPSTLKSDLSLK